MNIFCAERFFKEKRVRIGIFGGTFNPVHNGHRALAVYVQEQLSLDRFDFVPAYNAPHKENASILPWEFRLQLLSLALDGLENIKINTIESNSLAKSYTEETLHAYNKENPQTALFFILGAESFLSLDTWKNGLALPFLAEFVIVQRFFEQDAIIREFIEKNFPQAQYYACEKKWYLSADKKHGLQIVNNPLYEVSSTDIREKYLRGEDISSLVPELVLNELECDRAQIQKIWQS